MVRDRVLLLPWLPCGEHKILGSTCRQPENPQFVESRPPDCHRERAHASHTPNPLRIGFCGRGGFFVAVRGRFPSAVGRRASRRSTQSREGDKPVLSPEPRAPEIVRCIFGLRIPARATHGICPSRQGHPETLLPRSGEAIQLGLDLGLLPARSLGVSREKYPEPHWAWVCLQTFVWLEVTHSHFRQDPGTRAGPRGCSPCCGCRSFP